MASPREQADAASAARAYRQALPASAYRQPLRLPPVDTRPIPRRHHFHDYPPWPHQRYGDYIVIEGWGWWPRWYPYWDQRWYSYWWQLYDYYGGDANPEYAEYARDAILRQQAPQWGLTVSGSWMGAEPARAPIVRDHRGATGIVPTHGSPVLSPGRGIVPTHGSPLSPRPSDYDDRYRRQDYDDRYRRQRYQHPHDYYGDYVVVQGAWWPRWFPYWDPAWARYWLQLYYYYGGDAQGDYAQYARDAYLRSMAAQWGWI